MDNPIIQTTNLSETFQALRGSDPLKIQKQNIESHPDYPRVPRTNYSPIAVVNTGSWGGSMTRQAGVSTGGTIYGQPGFFSPVHTSINWQIPSKRLEQYQWARFFYENEPKVGSSIDFYAQFPMSDWEHECRNRKVKLYFDKLKKKLKLNKWCRLISHEVHLLGDCFPFVEIDCPACGGGGKLGSEICEHEGGTVRRIVILNPDYVEVLTGSMNPDPVIALRPDEELINMVQRKTPGYEKLSLEVIKLISAGQPIRLDNRNVSHLKYGECGYQKYGIGMVRRLFPILSYKTKLMVAQWIVAERLIVPIKVVKIGSDERPAGPADIAAAQAQLAATANDPNLTIVTHHAFELDWIGACYSSDTEVLTENGWKKYSQVSKNFDEKIATYNLNSNCLEYQIPSEYHEYDYNGEMCCFDSKHYDSCVTPNHRMLAQERIWDNDNNKYKHSEWKVIRADQITENSRFKTTLDWKGQIPEKLPYEKEKILGDLSLEHYLKFIGYYLSEGGLKIDNGVINAVHVTQKENNKCFASIKKCMDDIGYKVQYSEDKRDEVSCWQFIINNSEMAREVAINYGENSGSKYIPQWIKNLPSKDLCVLLNSMMEGDGSVRFSDSGKVRYKYTTTSEMLANDVQEIVLKLGYDPKMYVYDDGNELHNKQYIVFWSQGIKNNGFRSVKERNIKRLKYNGKVWCFTVPNGFFITRRNGKISIQGNSGKILTLSNEFEFINQEILDGMMINNALLNGEGPNFTHCAKTRLLTNNGLKYCDEFDIEKDLVATFNIHTKALEYQKATQKFEYQWDSINGDDPPMKRFLTNRIDMMVTPNHRMLCAERKLTTKNGEGGQKVNGQKEGFGDWECVRAYDVKKRSKFRACVDNWDEITEDNGTYCGLTTKDFLTIIGWYVSEGYRNKWVRKDGSESISKVSFSQSENANKTVYDKMSELLKRNGIYHMVESSKNVFYIRKSDNEALVQYLSSNCGGYANSKCIPPALKNMSKNNLKILLDALVEGDGSERQATKKKPTTKQYYSYTTVSRQLRDDVVEILFKLGFSPRFNTIEFDSSNLQTQYQITWSDNIIGRFPVLDSRRWNNEKKSCNSKSEQVISDEDYVGKVWCVEVPNHFIITERNGLFGIHGNSSAAVGIEAMIKRLKTFRQQISEWMLEAIYVPEALRQGFVEKDEETGEDEVIVPELKWDNMHLRDQQQDKNFAIQLYEKGLLSAQTVLEMFEYNADQELERKRYDSLQMVALGQGGGQGGGGGMGGGGGGMPPLGGGGGGGPGGEPPIGGPGGGEMGGPGTPPGAPPSPTGMGGPAISKASSMSAVEADPNQFGGMVLKKRTRERIERDQQKVQRAQESQLIRQQKAQNAAADGKGQMRDEKGRIMFTGAERKLIPLLKQAQKDGLLRDVVIYPQFRVTSGDEEYVIDFAVPNLKVGIEADGEIFHSAPKQVAHDKERDGLLGQQGWTIKRFTDKEIEKHPQQVVQEVIKVIMQKQLMIQNQAAQADQSNDLQQPQQPQ